MSNARKTTMITRWNSECVKCMTRKFLDGCPESASEAERMEYLKHLFAILSSAKPEEGAPVVTYYIEQLQKKMFGVSADFTDIKRAFNELMLSQETRILADIKAADEPLKKAIQYVMCGNYIDFGVLDNVNDDQLLELLSKADTQKIDDTMYHELYTDLSHADQLTYITDNCGEIVLDKLMIQTIKSEFPAIKTDIIVRGMPALNDATMEDAVQTGLTDIANVTGNGTGIAGTFLPKISDEASRIIHNADVLISKGQGNFETLRGCGLNIYYIFLCKCRLFTERFHTKQYEGILTNEKYCN